MKKKTMAVSLMALALLISPVGGLDFMPSVNAEETESVVSSVSGNTSVSRDATQKVQLDAPTNVRWGMEEGWSKKYSLYWEGVNESVDENGRVLWNVELCRDGEQIILEDGLGYRYYTTGIAGPYYEDAEWDSEGFKYVGGTIPSKEHEEFFFNIYTAIRESGNYTFRVQAEAYGDDYKNSEWVESQSINYVHPDQELGVTSGYWDTERAGVCHFTRLENEQNFHIYWVTLWKQDESGTRTMLCARRNIVPRVSDNMIMEVDFSDSISRSGEGKYYFTVQAFSQDIDVVAHGIEGPASDILDTTVNTGKLSDILAGIAGKSATETVELLTETADISAIQQAMQTSDAFREQVKDLEDRYSVEQDITVQSPIVSDAAQVYVDPSKVNVVGAAFNAAQGRAVGLQMDVTPEENRVPVYSGYKESVQVDIRLVSDDAEIHDLAMPVSVTMPIPQGIDASQLVILHYHGDGTTEQTAFHVNGDGTITFTVSCFSTFVFAERSEGETSGHKPGPTPGQNENSNGSGSSSSAAMNNLENKIASAAPGAIIKVTKEQNINTLSSSIMQLLAKRGDVALEMEYTYEGVDYHVIIPAGMAADNGIDWYGPLYLSAYYGADSIVGSPEVESTIVYIVKKGDTLGQIARSYQTTVARLMAANPQIKNANRIRTGQIINIK